MADTFQQAVAACTSPAESLATRLTKIKVLLDATETAMFNAAVGGDVKAYKVNTGQTTIDVEAQSVTSLAKKHKSLYALYNELLGLVSGSNVMVMRDASTLGR